MASINLKGSSKYLTANPEDYFEVKSGHVDVYVTRVEGIDLGRSMYLCNVSSGVTIPPLALGNVSGKDSYTFMLQGSNEAQLEIVHPDEDESEKIKNDFLKGIPSVKESEERFSIRILNWYNDILDNESEIIDEIRSAKDDAVEEKERLFSSMFGKQKDIFYESTSNSPLYNTLSVYCDFLKVNICPYRMVFADYGDDFSVEDVARISHFVTRRITLQKKWYTQDMGAFLGFYKDEGGPVLCVPGKHGTFIMYDIEQKRSYAVDEEVAGLLGDEGYIIYPHLPQGKITFKDAVMFALKRCRTSDMTNFLIIYILITLVGLLLPFLNKIMYDQLIPLHMWDSIIQVGGVILACMIGNVFFTVVRNLASFRGVKTMEYTIVSAAYDRIFKLPQRFIERFGTMELINRVNSVSGVFTEVVSSGVSAIVGFTLGLIYLIRMFKESRALSWRVIVLTVISSIIMYLFGRARISREKERMEESTKANGMLYQFIAGILKIKVSGIENRSLLEFEKHNSKSLSLDIRSTRIQNIGGIVSSVLDMVISGFIYYTVVKKNQELSIGDYAAFTSAYGMFSSAFSTLMGFLLTQASLVPVIDRIKPIFEEECEVTDNPKSLGKLSGELEVNHLDFTYEGETKPVLTDINMRIHKGEFVGIVGATGCGKSTLLKCLLGFEKPTGGKILYDNKLMDTLDMCELRRHIGVVLQNGKLLAGNIYSNITLASPNLSVQDVMKLLEEVDLDKDVEKMPMGVFTGISEDGGTVSGGQQQRILIARALANNPSIVFFDEATSALDNVTQQKVCENLKNRNITRVMIAHRLSTVMNCDRIYVMDNGSIVETGDYAELMDKKGVFYDLVLRQKLEEV